MSSMKKTFHKFKHVIYFISIFILLFFIPSSSLNDKQKIIKIFSTPEYSYLTKKARNYITETYYNTGEVLLTEKNKVSNQPYLNPAYVSYLELSVDEQSKIAVIPDATIVDYVAIDTLNDNSLPSKFTLKNDNGNNYVTPVRNQGNLGICWAFSTAGVMETKALKTKGVSYSSSANDLISERQIDYATSINGINDYENPYVTYNKRFLGRGGNFLTATIAMASGLSSYDYNSFVTSNNYDSETMYELQDVLNYQNSKYEVNSTINLTLPANITKYAKNPPNDEKATLDNFVNNVKNNIIENGAAYVSTYSNNRCSYNDSSNNLFIDVYNCLRNDSTDDAHAMQIIGWDDEYTYKYCADTDKHTTYTSSCKDPIEGKGAWILKNSWGNIYPTVYLAYDSQGTEVGFIKSYNDASKRTWDNNYLMISENSEPGKIYALHYNNYLMSAINIKDTEILTKIKLTAYNYDATYTITIRDATGKVHTLTASSETPGLITVDVADIPLNSSSSITIYGNESYKYFHDTVMIFTKNNTSTPSIKFANTDSVINAQDFRLYSDTKNIPANSTITYKLYDSSNQDISSSMTYEYNKVAANNTNPRIHLSSNLKSGTYRIDAIYNSNTIDSFTFNYSTMKGNGTAISPYIITNASQLNTIRNKPESYYELANDIDLTAATSSGGTFYNNGFGWDPIENFSGSFDGKGHTIKGLKLKTKTESATKETSNGGLFGKIDKNVTIKNLTLEGFDLYCHGDCGLLASSYHTISATYDVNISNIALKDCRIKGEKSINTGTLISYLNGGINTTVNLSNIYIDADSENYGLTRYLRGSTVNLKNIQINTNAGEGATGLFNYAIATQVNIENVFSTFNSSKTESLLVYTFNNTEAESFNIKNTNVYKIADKNYIYNISSDNNSKLHLTDVNSLTFTELKDSNNYKTWSNFSDNWKMETIDGIPRFPVLKFVSFAYTKVDDISVDLEAATYKSIYDFIYPKTSAAKRIIYEVADESIATINESGQIIPKKRGTTKVHIKSLYDGYESDVPLTVISNIPTYNLSFNSNGGTGTMASYEIEYNADFILPINKFVKTNYEFQGWNTKADGRGTSYDNATIINIKDILPSNKLTLYAIWKPFTYTIKFNNNGGIGTIDDLLISFDETRKLPKNILTKQDYIFKEWNTKSDGTGSSYQDEASIINLATKNNEVITLYAIWEKDIGITSSIYEINKESNVINNISINTTPTTFQENLKVSSGYRIELDLKGKTNLATGSITKIYKDNILVSEFTNIVKGDTNGDAKITYLDYVNIYNHIYKTKNPSSDRRLLEGEYLLAADMSNDNKITYLDYVLIYNKIIELKGGK